MYIVDGKKVKADAIRNAVKIGGKWVEPDILKKLDAETQAARVNGKWHNLTSDEVREEIQIDGEWISEYEKEKSLADKIVAVREAVNTQVGRLANSPKDDEYETWKKLQKMMEEVDSKGKPMASSGVISAMKVATEAFTKGLEVYEARKKEKLTWEELYTTGKGFADPRVKIDRGKKES